MHRDLKTACRIDFTFWYGLNTTKTLDTLDLGHSTKTNMAATAVWRLTLHPMQDIACERDSLKTIIGHVDYQFLTYSSIWIDFIFLWGMKNHKTVIKLMYINELVWNLFAMYPETCAYVFFYHYLCNYEEKNWC